MEKEYCIFGRKPILEALNSGRQIDKIMLLKTAHGEDLNVIAAKARQENIPVQFVPVEKIEFAVRKFTRNREANHQGAVAFVSLLNTLSIEEMLEKVAAQGKIPFVVVLDGVTDVGNFGAIARSAYCFGAQAIVMAAKGSAPISPEAIKTSTGALEKLMICKVENIATAVKYLKAHGLKVYATSEKAKVKVADVDFNPAVAIVLGDEGEGVSNIVMKQCDEMLLIPMASNFDSLNVSVSAGVVFYEAMKQRTA
jgi:23S rRNA (guanosine2251-2'-O)-methyltransferase